MHRSWRIRRTFWAGCLLWQVCTSLVALAESRPDLPAGFQSRTYRDESGDHRYTLFVPRQFSSDRNWPVVLFLHGAGERGHDGLLPLAGGLAAALEQWPDAPFLAVFPQCEDMTGRALTGWLADGPDGRRAMEILAQVERDYPIDPGRRILAGWSMGGYGAWSLAAADPKHWSAVLALAGGEVDHSLSLQSLAAARTPVWAIHGAEDQLIPSDRSKRLVEQLAAQGGKAFLTTLPGVGHDVWRRVFASPETFHWLLNPQTAPPSLTSFTSVTPLPSRTRFYRENLVRTETIPAALAMRLGNDALREISSDLPQLVPESLLSGSLPDILRDIGSGAGRTQVRLTGVRYRCRPTECRLHAISGGRLAIQFGLQPLELEIARTELIGRDTSARCGPMRITIGSHAPAQLGLEVQPAVVSGRLRLFPLRQVFTFSDGNWYVQPPEDVQVQGGRFLPEQVRIGLVGSLYTSRGEIINEILKIVPELLQEAERQLQSQPAPQLAKLLSPLPGLTPELRTSPAQVRTDPAGVSVIGNILADTRGQAGKLPLGQALELADCGRGGELRVAVALQAMTLLSQLSVDQDLACINVLDISESIFGPLAEAKSMHRVLPDLVVEEGEQIRTALRLQQPLTVSPAKRPGSLGSETELMMTSNGVALDVWKEPPRAAPLPVGRIVFSLAQPIVIHIPPAGDSSTSSIQVRWLPECEITFLRGESLHGSAAPQIHAAAFESMFRSAWQTWSREHGSQSLPARVGQLGTTQVRVRSLDVADQRIELTFVLQH